MCMCTQGRPCICFLVSWLLQDGRVIHIGGEHIHIRDIDDMAYTTRYLPLRRRVTLSCILIRGAVESRGCQHTLEFATL